MNWKMWCQGNGRQLSKHFKNHIHVCDKKSKVADIKRYFGDCVILNIYKSYTISDGNYVRLVNFLQN